MNSMNQARGSGSASPTPEEIRDLRKSLKLSQTAAAVVVHSTLRTWQDWEAGIARMHPGLWELFRLKAGPIAKATATK